MESRSFVREIEPGIQHRSKWHWGSSGSRPWRKGELGIIGKAAVGSST